MSTPLKIALGLLAGWAAVLLVGIGTNNLALAGAAAGTLGLALDPFLIGLAAAAGYFTRDARWAAAGAIAAAGALELLMLAVGEGFGAQPTMLRFVLRCVPALIVAMLLHEVRRRRRAAAAA